MNGNSFQLLIYYTTVTDITKCLLTVYFHFKNDYKKVKLIVLVPLKIVEIKEYTTQLNNVRYSY